MADKLFTLGEVASFYRVDVRTIRRWVSLGRLSPFRIGKTIRFSKEQINNTLKPGYETKKNHDSAMG